jgi:hypothetical protein
MEIGGAGGPPAEGQGPSGRSEPGLSWDDLVLPPRERDVLRAAVAEAQARRKAGAEAGNERGGEHSQGLTLVLTGGQGTGKTMATRLLAADLGAEIVELNLAIVSELDRDRALELIRRAFADAESSNAVLLVDRVESVIATSLRASTVRERPPSVELSELVQASKSHAGVVVFASRASTKLEPSLGDGVDFLVEIPVQWTDEQRQIWRRQLRRHLEVTDADLDYLAASFALSGGEIQKISAAAVAYAGAEGVPVKMVHVGRMLELEYQHRLFVGQRTREALDRLTGRGVGARSDAPAAKPRSTRAAAVGAAAKTTPVLPRAESRPSAMPPPPAATPVPARAAAKPPPPRAEPKRASVTAKAAGKPIPARREPVRGRIKSLLGRGAAPGSSAGALHEDPYSLDEWEPTDGSPLSARIEAALGSAAAPKPATAAPKPATAARPAPPLAKPAADPAPPPTPARPARTERGLPALISPRSAVLASLSILVAAALGFGVARATGGSQPRTLRNKHAAAGLVQITFPSTWREERPPFAPALGLAHELAIGPGSPGRGIFVLGTSDTQNGKFLPNPLVAVLSSRPLAPIVTLGGARFYRYADVHVGATGSSGPVYTLPTTGGTVIGVCIPQGAPGFPSSCEAILATMRLASATALPPGQDKSYAAALNTGINKLNEARTKAVALLSSARTARAQAEAAAELARAHGDADAALRALSAGPAAAANSAVVVALRTTADAYAALAAAAARNDARAYRTASSTVIRANAALLSALSRLRSFGYRVG